MRTRRTGNASQMMGNPVEHLTKELDLTPEQQATVGPIIDQAKPQLEAIHREAMEKTRSVMETAPHKSGRFSLRNSNKVRCDKESARRNAEFDEEVAQSEAAVSAPERSETGAAAVERSPPLSCFVVAGGADPGGKDEASLWASRGQRPRATTSPRAGNLGTLPHAFPKVGEQRIVIGRDSREGRLRNTKRDRLQRLVHENVVDRHSGKPRRKGRARTGRAK